MNICLGDQIDDKDVALVKETLKRNANLVQLVEKINSLTTESGVDLCIKDNDDCTPLHLGALHNQTEAVRQVLTDIDTNTEAITGPKLLHIIAAHGHVTLMSLLADE